MHKQTFLGMAYLISQESKCCSYRVGCVIEKDGRIVSTGYNGTPSGQMNCNEHCSNEGWTTPFGQLKVEHRTKHSEWSGKNEIHAELNAILFAARNGISIQGATLWATASPCPDCAKAIANSGIKKIVYGEVYDRNGGVGWKEILTQSGVEVEYYPYTMVKRVDFTQVKTMYRVE